MAEISSSETIIIGLSGPSSSGKTTLARLLRGIFNIEASPKTNGISIRLFILHEDDFYKTDEDIPIRTITSPEHGTRQVQDWDCVESLNLPLLTSTLTHVKHHGRPPPDLLSKEDQNSVGEVGVSDAEITSHRNDIISWLSTLDLSSHVNDTDSSNKNNNVHDSTHYQITICMLDGFLLFPPPPSLHHPPSSSSPPLNPTPSLPPSSLPLLSTLHQTLSPLLTTKLFLPATKHQTLHRRTKRTGYVTMEGFWADPPGYVEDVVWPNYARDHAWLFDWDLGRVDRGDVFGTRVVEGEGIKFGPLGVDMREVVDWGVGVVRGAVLQFLGEVRMGMVRQ